mmetsp:Transcript_66811/g.186476  ORF Transcript_66811/g.186476 Transcript_66811/m.186476 type:complete len:304 (+) Transcript_66811:46-957(+)
MRPRNGRPLAGGGRGTTSSLFRAGATITTLFFLAELVDADESCDNGGAVAEPGTCAASASDTRGVDARGHRTVDDADHGDLLKLVESAGVGAEAMASIRAQLTRKADKKVPVEAVDVDGSRAVCGATATPGSCAAFATDARGGRTTVVGTDNDDLDKLSESARGGLQAQPSRRQREYRRNSTGSVALEAQRARTKGIELHFSDLHFSVGPNFDEQIMAPSDVDQAGRVITFKNLGRRVPTIVWDGRRHGLGEMKLADLSTGHEFSAKTKVGELFDIKMRGKKAATFTVQQEHPKQLVKIFDAE